MFGIPANEMSMLLVFCVKVNNHFSQLSQEKNGDSLLKKEKRLLEGMIK